MKEKIFRNDRYSFRRFEEILDKFYNGAVTSIKEILTITGKDSHILHVELFIYKYEYTKERDNIVVIQAFDVTGYKQLEYKLKKSDEKLRAVLEASSDIALILDKNGKFYDIISSPGSVLFSNKNDLM